MASASATAIAPRDIARSNAKRTDRRAHHRKQHHERAGREQRLGVEMHFVDPRQVERARLNQ